VAYATIVELTAKLGRTPTNSQQLLDRASGNVDSALLSAVYDPADAAVITALREATLEQVACNLDQGDLTGSGSTRPNSFTIGKLSVQRSSMASKDNAGGPVKIGDLWKPAWLVLQAAGLTGFAPRTW
jgi:hypothetical protein